MSFRAAVLSFAMLFAAAGCVERKLMIATVPDAADVYVDGHHVGQSPVTLPFTFYGTSEIVVRKPGYLTERHLETRVPPDFQRFPKDLYYETLTSELYVDERRYVYTLAPQPEEASSRERVEQAMRSAKALEDR